ncbi:MAG: hypothetical protein M1132_10655 [Chloroflexi bacterium]|nr:hypothetical protein [Chloroflexota bacterium]
MPRQVISLMVYLNDRDVEKHGGLCQARDKITAWLDANILQTQNVGAYERSEVKTLEGEDLDFLRELIWFSVNYHRETESEIVAEHLDLGERCEWCGNFHVERHPVSQAILRHRFVDHTAEIRAKEQELLEQEKVLKAVP